VPAIKKIVDRVPGGMMVVPLCAGAILTTLFPNMPRLFGSFTGALFTGALPILAVFYVCIGSTIDVRSLPLVLRRGGALLAAKIFLGFLCAVVFGRLLGVAPVHRGWFAGLSTLAIVAAINDTNGGIYIALMGQYGSPEDAAAYSVMALESGPFLTMLSLGLSGLAGFPWQTILGAILPLVVGMLLGNLDADMRKFLGGAAPAMVPFFAFALGATLNLHQIIQAGLLGLLMGVAVLLVSAVCLGFVNRLTGDDGTAGIAASTTAGNAAAVPALVAAASPAYAEAAGPATVLVGASVIVTALLAPLLTAWWHRRVMRKLANHRS
jgi:2-keto-3-deoxygluconate permease